MKRISLLITALFLASCAQHPDPVVHHQKQNTEIARELAALRVSRSLFRSPPPQPQIGTALVIVKPTQPKPKPKVHHSSAPDIPRGVLEAYAARLVGSTQFRCVDAIFTLESHWNPKARNSWSGAFGIPQRMHPPAHWTDPYIQIKWGIDYMNSRYGSPCAAWNYWEVHHSY